MSHKLSYISICSLILLLEVYELPMYLTFCWCVGESGIKYLNFSRWEIPCYLIGKSPCSDRISPLDAYTSTRFTFGIYIAFSKLSISIIHSPTFSRSSIPTNFDCCSLFLPSLALLMSTFFVVVCCRLLGLSNFHDKVPQLNRLIPHSNTRWWTSCHCFATDHMGISNERTDTIIIR